MLYIGLVKLISIILGVVGGGMVGALTGLLIGAFKVMIGKRPRDETWNQSLTISLIEGVIYGALFNVTIIILFY